MPLKAVTYQVVIRRSCWLLGLNYNVHCREAGAVISEALAYLAFDSIARAGIGYHLACHVDTQACHTLARTHIHTEAGICATSPDAKGAVEFC